MYLFQTKERIFLISALTTKLVHSLQLSSILTLTSFQMFVTTKVGL